MSQVNSLWQLYLFYGVIVGAGLGGIFVPLNSTVARWFGASRNSMTGIVVSGIGIGTMIAPLVANSLIRRYDWRVSYLILGVGRRAGSGRVFV
jgi:MFS family permease